MEAKTRAYNYLDGVSRIRDILNQSDVSYEEVKELPSRDDLTFSNGFYSYATALFIDIRKSSELPDKHKRPVLARLYRAFVSEMVAVLTSHSRVREVNIVGDCVWAIYNTPNKVDVDEAFSIAAKAFSMVKILNKELAKRDITTIKVGLGLEYGRALMVKAGYSGSGINDVVYMGDVVNKAAKLASQGNKELFDNALMVGNTLYGNLKDENKKLLVKSSYGCYEGTVVNTAIEKWTDENY